MPIRLAMSRPLLVAILAISQLLALASAVLFQAPDLLGKEKTLMDFDAFFVAGTMAAEGRPAETYDPEETFATQQRMTGEPSFMPWTYPPPYTLLMEGLAALPVGLSYVLFISATFAFYVVVLRRISGAYLPGVLIAILPTLLVTIRTGQNGFLTGGLIGCFLLAFNSRRAIAGLPLGLMAAKPHLAAGISLLALLGRRWKAMAIAAGIVSAALLVTTAAYGPGIWTAFAGGVREAGEFLAMGYYQFYRMTSVYAAIRSFGGTASVALVVHALGALAAIGFLVQLWRTDCSPQVIAAAACISSLFVSPYCYDYDLTILGVGIAFILPDIIERSRSWELAGMLLLLWLATGYGLSLVIYFGDPGSGLRSANFWSLGAPALILFSVCVGRILRRNRASSVAGPARRHAESPA